MSIKRITNPEEFKVVLDDLMELFKQDDVDAAHQLLSHSVESIKNAFSHKSILAWDFFLWANFNGSKFDAIIAFVNDKNVKFNESIFSEYLWLSKNPKVGYKLFSTAIKFAKANDFKYISMNTVVKHPKHEKIKSFYTKLGFLKDSETYISKL
jgi:hypothetical protein